MGRLAAFCENELGPNDAARVKRHLSACAACQQEVAALQSVRGVLLGHKPAAPDPAPELWQRIAAEIAASPAAPQNSGRARVSFRLPALGGGLAAAVAAVAGVAWVASHRPDVPAAAPVGTPGQQVAAAPTSVRPNVRPNNPRPAGTRIAATNAPSAATPLVAPPGAAPRSSRRHGSSFAAASGASSAATGVVDPFEPARAQRAAKRSQQKPRFAPLFVADAQSAGGAAARRPNADSTAASTNDNGPTVPMVAPAQTAKAATAANTGAPADLDSGAAPVAASSPEQIGGGDAARRVPGGGGAVSVASATPAESGPVTAAAGQPLSVAAAEQEAAAAPSPTLTAERGVAATDSAVSRYLSDNRKSGLFRYTMAGGASLR